MQEKNTIFKGDYFKVEEIVFEEIQKFIDKYKKIPTKTTLNIEIENRKDLNQDDHDKIVKLISTRCNRCRYRVVT